MLKPPLSRARRYREQSSGPAMRVVPVGQAAQRPRNAAPGISSQPTDGRHPCQHRLPHRRRHPPELARRPQQYLVSAHHRRLHSPAVYVLTGYGGEWYGPKCVEGVKMTIRSPLAVFLSNGSLRAAACSAHGTNSVGPQTLLRGAPTTPTGTISPLSRSVHPPMERGGRRASRCRAAQSGL